MGDDIVYVHVFGCLPRVTAVCQGLCSLLQMAQQVAPRVPRLPALIDQGRGSHGLGAYGLIAVAWPLGPLRPLRGSEGLRGRPAVTAKTIGASSPSSHPPPTTALNSHVSTHTPWCLAWTSLIPVGRRVISWQFSYRTLGQISCPIKNVAEMIHCNTSALS